MRRRTLLQGPGTASYLRVKPEEVQWITTDSPVVYQVESNEDWIIE